MMRTRQVPLLGALTVVGAVVALTGCGTGDDQQQARAVAQRFAAALDGGDAATACALLTTKARDQLEQQEGKRCTAAIGSLQAPPSRITRTEVFITNAKIDFPGGESAFLDREAKGWRLSAVGCKAAEGKPADRPEQCDLQA